MAAISSIPLPPLPKTLNLTTARKLPLSFPKPHTFPHPASASASFHTPRIPALQSSSSASTEEEQRRDEESMSIQALKSFIRLNLGKWNGTFYQFDPRGKLLQQVTTKLSVSSYGEEDLISLLQTSHDTR